MRPAIVAVSAPRLVSSCACAVVIRDGSPPPCASRGAPFIVRKEQP